MDHEGFVRAVREDILEANLGYYRGVLEGLSIDEATDEYWREALDLYSRLSVEDRARFHSVLRQVMVDTVSSLFSVLDGSSFLKGQKEDFVFSYRGSDLNGELQDTFLMVEEND